MPEEFSLDGGARTLMRVSGLGRLYERTVEIERLTVPLSTRGAPGLLNVIEGPAGIGKTRLLGEGRLRAREQGWLVLHACGLELERGFSFGIARQLFEPFLRGQSSAELESLTAGAAGVARSLVLGPADESGDGSFAVLHGLTCLVMNIANSQKLLIQVDDLQWADEASLRWLVYLLPRIEELPVGFTGALRRGAVDDAGLVQRVAGDPRLTVIRPDPLHDTSVARMLTDSLRQEADAEFVAVCHAETGGNPFLVREIVTWLRHEHITPISPNIGRLREIGGIAVAGRVAARLTQLPADVATFARALAVLGDGADLHHLSELASLSSESAAAAVHMLQRCDLVGDRGRLSFVHPVVRTAVYESIPLPERMAIHAEAATLLEVCGAANERVAAQVLHAPPGLNFATRVLRTAAVEAIQRGAFTSACEYLARCGEEPLDPDALFEVLMTRGVIGQRVDVGAAIGCLTKALSLAADRRRRADASWHLANSYLYAGRVDEAAAILNESIDELPAVEQDARQRAQATRLIITSLIPDHLELLENLPALRSVPLSEGFGGRILGSAIALRDALTSDPSAVIRARRALAITDVDPGAFVVSAGPAWHVLIAADVDDALTHVNHAATTRHKDGGLTALATTYMFRGLCWIHRGHLTEAEADGRHAQQLLNASSVHIGRPFTGAYLAEALMDQGKLTEAAEVLEWCSTQPESVSSYPVLGMRARLARLSGQYSQARDLALACGRVFTGHGADNPAISPWRSELALSLLALGETTQARHSAEHELSLAEQWGAPRALGRALRVQAATLEPSQREPILRKATDILEGTPIRLELARALADLGPALLVSGSRDEAREVLRRAHRLAAECDAPPLVDQIRGNLRAAGARARRHDLTGLESLTLSERNVAELAAAGSTNREISETLFVTQKTVELHLTNVYRKLSIHSRNDLANALD